MEAEGKSAMSVFGSIVKDADSILDHHGSMVILTGNY